MLRVRDVYVSQIRIFPSRIPGSKRTPDPGSGSATLGISVPEGGECDSPGELKDGEEAGTRPLPDTPLQLAADGRNEVPILKIKQ